MIIVGLTGSIAMGKSVTADLFRQQGIPVHDADAVVHELYSGPAANLIEQEFPGVTVDGKVDRNALGKFVIGNPLAMRQLEAIIHPLVAQERKRFLQEAESKGVTIVVLDIPLLFETGIDRLCDYVVVVTTMAEIQRERVLSRPDMSAEKFEKLLASQLSDREKRKRADFIVDSSYGIENAGKQVKELLEAIKAEIRTNDKSDNGI